MTIMAKAYHKWKNLEKRKKMEKSNAVPEN